MIDMVWLEEQLANTENAIELSNRFYWNLTINFMNDTWIVVAGEKVILRVDNKEALDAFLYGMGLAYSIFSPVEIQRFRDDNPYEG